MLSTLKTILANVNYSFNLRPGFTMESASELLSKARLLFEAGETADSLNAVKQAYEIRPDAKIARKIELLENVLRDEQDKENENKTAKLVARLEAEARQLFSAKNDIDGALAKLREALKLCPSSDRLQRRIDRLLALKTDQQPKKKENPALARVAIDDLITKAGNLSIQEEGEDKEVASVAPSRSSEPSASRGNRIAAQYASVSIVYHIGDMCHLL